MRCYELQTIEIQLDNRIEKGKRICDLQQIPLNPPRTGKFLQQNMEEFSKYNFSAINFKKVVALRFREFAKELSKTNTGAMESMLNFFHHNGLLPDDDLGIKNEVIKKRINSLIAILKNIEKHQTKPTAAMLKTLFEETANLEEKEHTFESPSLISENEELEYYRKNYFKTQEAYNARINEIQTLLERIVHIKGNFGKGRLKLEMDLSEFELLKERLTNVHNHNPSEAGH